MEKIMKELSEHTRSGSGGSVEAVSDDEDSTASSNLYSLKWNGFEEIVCNGFASLLYSEELTDVTLACDGQLIKAHKIVLAMCSPFFRKIFNENPCKHPIVIIKGIKFREVKNVLQFVYLGEVRVRKHEINEFFEAADSLKIDGLDCEQDISKYVSNDDLTETPSNHAASTMQMSASHHDQYTNRETENNFTHLHSRKSYNELSLSTSQGRYEYPSNMLGYGMPHDTSNRNYDVPMGESAAHYWSDTHAHGGNTSSPERGPIISTPTTRSYQPSCTAVSADMDTEGVLTVRRSTDGHSEEEEVDLSTRRHGGPLSNVALTPRHLYVKEPNSLPGGYESVGEKSNSSSNSRMASSLPEPLHSPVATTTGVIISTTVARPSREEFEPKWEAAVCTTTSGIPITTITKPSESYPKLYKISPHHHPSRLPLPGDGSEVENLSLMSKSTGQAMSLSSGTLVPNTLSLSGQPMCTTAGPSFSPGNTGTESHPYTMTSTTSSTAPATSTLSALRARISTGSYGYTPGRFRSYHQTSSSASATAFTPVGSRTSGFSGRSSEMPNPKTKQIRSSQVPPSSRYTATEVDAMVDQVQHYPGNLVPCALCQKVVKRERLRAHIHECHLLHGERIICPHCGIGLKSKGSYRVHIWRHKRGTLSSRLSGLPQ